MARDLYADEYPASWYCLAPSSSLPPGAVQDLSALGKKLVLWRSASGVVHVSERFCPHMGASLGQGFVRGEHLVCPFHHWEYGADGRCAKIPYLDEAKIPARACLETWPLKEHLGMIWIWNGDTPAFELPDIPEAHDKATWGRVEKTQVFDIHPLLILENGCDAQHFKYVHKIAFHRYDVEVIEETAHDFAFDVHQEIARKDGSNIVLTTSIHYVGASVIYGATALGGEQRYRFIAAPLPTGPKQTRFHLVVFPRRMTGALRLIDPFIARYIAKRVFDGATDDYLPIWRHMDTGHRGVLVEDDRLQQRYRRYYEDHFPRAPTPKNVLPIVQSA